MRIGLAVACLVAWSQPAAAEEMRIATLAPAGTPWMEALERAAAEIAEKTENRVTVKYFPGGQMGDERDFVRKIKLGQIDGAAVTSMGLAMIEPSILVLQLPMLFATEDELDYVATKRAFASASAARSAGSTSSRRTRSGRWRTSARRSSGRSETPRSAGTSSTS